MYFFVANYYTEEQKTTLVDRTKQMVQLVTYGSSYDDYEKEMYIDSPDEMADIFGSCSVYWNADVFLVSNKGEVLLRFADGEEIDDSKRFPQSVLAQTNNSEYFDQMNLDGFLKGTNFTAGLPVVMKDADQNNRIPAYCFVSIKSSFISGLTFTFMKIFLIAALIVLVIVVFIVFVMSYRMVLPLRQISDAVKKFAVGDFSIRVPESRNDEIGQLGKAFNEMADSLSASEAMRRSFIANVSHELKTPMTTIAGFIDGMLDGTIPKNEHPKYMRIVSNEVKRLSRLVTSMLSLSRIDNGELKVKKQEFEMFSMIITILTTFETQIENKEIEIQGLEDFQKIAVNADPDLIYQVIYNLIENAVKFTNDKGYIRFTKEMTRFDISVSIENSGPGIPPEDIKYIFDRFYKTDKSRSIDKKGMGLGLFISKTIMRMHGGDIFVESETDNFTRFTFRLPVENKKAGFKTDKGKKKYIETTAIEVETKENGQ